MGDLSVIPKLGYIKTFIQKYQQLSSVDGVIGYYCLLYAAQYAIKYEDEECKAYTVMLLDTLEAMKNTLDNEAIGNEVVGYAYVEDFALRVFNAADKVVRSGGGSAKTVASFKAACIFFELLKVFGDIEEAVLEKIKYSKFKAVEISRRINEQTAQATNPTGPTSDNNQPISSQNTHQSLENSHPNNHHSLENSHQNTQPINQSTSSHPSHLQENYSSQEMITKQEAMEKASKHAKYAQSALQYEDVLTAMKNLEEAMKLLKGIS